MIHADSIPFDDAAEADLIDQHTPTDDSDDEGLDPAQITRSGAASEADLIDQAFKRSALRRRPVIAEADTHESAWPAVSTAR